MAGVGAWLPGESASGCVGAPRAGTLALSRAVLETRAGLGLGSYGIYNCRASTGGHGWSVHAEGRAWDCSVPTDDSPIGHQLLDDLAALATPLGLQRVIWSRVEYSADAPAGERYTGPDPHTSHLHIEQTRAAALSLTYAAALALLAPWDGGDAPMVIIGFSDVPGDTARWLLVGNKRLYLQNYTNVQALLDGGAVYLPLPRAVCDRIPQV